MTDRETIAETALMARELMPRFFAGFDENNRTRQAPNLPNHLVWTLGHAALFLAMTCHQLGDSQQAQHWHAKGIEWITSRQGILAKDQPLCSEAAQLIGVADADEGTTWNRVNEAADPSNRSPVSPALKES